MILLNLVILTYRKIIELLLFKEFHVSVWQCDVRSLLNDWILISFEKVLKKILSFILTL